MADGFQTIQVATENGVQAITLNRPDAMNAYNAAMSSELQTALRLAQRDDNIRCVVMTGAGRAFCAGQDLQEIKGCYLGEKPPLDFGAHLRKHYSPLIRAMMTLEKPIIAAVNGVAAGAGASFAFAADLRIAAQSASFVMAFVNIGLIPDSAATLTLARHVGYGRAMEMCLLGEKLSAEEAHRQGLVNRVVPDADLPEAVQQLAGKLASMPTRAIGLTKRALQHAYSATLESQLEYEAFLQATAGQSKDHPEGVRAFLEKRKPVFIGQ
jgi:2-(1,2-epoxy-1,2-dihydrophenyl)acetyl-CoA isomerase